ncbi:MAG: hypothetical protein Q4G46_09335, partial [Propionibacteriaceae bacterium]|nr:hypothetical protein [Propionibacteriaceae bacterium]
MSGGRGRLDLPRSHRGGFLPLAVGALAIGAGFAVILLLLLGPGSRTPGTSPGQPGDQARDSPTSARTADPISKRPAPAVPPPPPSATPDNVCAVGEPDFRGSGPAAGRLHGGGLTMPLPDHLDEGD